MNALNHSFREERPVSATPSQIYIARKGAELPDWIVERMTTTTVAGDGSYEIDTDAGPVTVLPGYAVFQVAEKTFACLPKDVPGFCVMALEDAGLPIPDAVATRATPPAPPAPKGVSKPPSAPKALRIKPMIGSPPTPAFVQVETLKVDDSYQRSIEGGASRKLIVKIAENWDWRLCLPLLASRRGDALYIIDGQHRLEAAKLRGDIRDLPVVVFTFDDPRAEAELFVAANRSRRPMSKLDDFHAAVVAGDSKALAVNEAVVAAGLEVGRIQAWQYWKPGEVVFVSAIQRSLHTQGKAIVHTALRTVAEAFQGQVLIGVGPIFEALCTMIHEAERASDPLDLGLMATVLAEVGLPGWKDAVAMENPESGSDRVDSMLRAMREAYQEARGE